LIQLWTNRLRHDHVGTVAILLKGSHAREDAGTFSDIDFDVLVPGAPIEDYPMYLVDRDGLGFRHVSIAVTDLESWLHDGTEPVDWALGFGVRVATRLLWAESDRVADVLDHPWREHPPAEPELEDFIEGLAKITNARIRGDDPGLRLAAQTMSRYAPGLLRPINPEIWPGTVREALDAALGFAIVPPNYREDLLRCLGLSPDPGSIDEICESACRLVRGVVQLLQPHAREMMNGRAGDPFLLLADGTIAHYVNQMQRWLNSGAAPER
jgi:predicted nucleotidyltransferase